MSARIKISQAGLSAGVAGVARTDGLDTGALVTLEDVDGVGESSFHLLWGPPEDTTAEASLAATVDPDIWTFSPDTAVYGSYLIELREDGVPVERRIFGIRTPANALLIPALNERASRHAAWDNSGADQIELSENNATDFPDAVLNDFAYAGWWRSLRELYEIVEFGTGSIADHAIALVKLVNAAAAPSVIGASTNGSFVEMPQATLAGLLRGVGLTVATGKLTPRLRPRVAQARDFFMSGLNTSGNIGALGFSLLGVGTPACTRASATQMGSSNRVALTTSNATNDRSTLGLGDTETRDILLASDLQLLQCAWNHDNSLTTKRVFFGLIGTLANDPAGAVDCLGVYYDSAVSANYQIIARSASTGSPTVTSTAVPANTAELMSIYQSTPGTFQFYSGDTLIGTISSGVPTAAMNVGFRLETLTTAVKTLNIGYFGIEATATGAFDDDTFLEA